MLRRFTQPIVVSPKSMEQPKFDRTVIVPFRNEADKIHLLVGDLKEQFASSLLHGEIIFIDDHSDDLSHQIVADLIKENPFFSLLKNIGKGKKAAIRTGVMSASYSRIITLDADVRLCPNWIIGAAFISDEFDLNILPVEIDSTRVKWFEHAEWQYLQGLTFQSVRAGGALMCNGAHLEFAKSLYDEMLPNERSVASGDDMFVLQKAKEIGEVGYMANDDFFVTTSNSGSWKDFFLRRIRWSSKNFKIQDSEIRKFGILAGLVYLLSLIVLLISFLSERYFIGLLLYFSLVWNNYYYVIPKSMRKKSKINLVQHFSFLVLLPLYTTLVALLSVFITPTWKGRKIKA